MTTMDLSKVRPGIRLTVEWLATHGFEVEESGDGKSADPEDAEVPYVSMRVTNSEALVSESRRLYTLLASRGIRVTADLDDDVSPCLYAAFEPASDHAVIDLVNVDDDLLFRSVS